MTAYHIACVTSHTFKEIKIQFLAKEPFFLCRANQAFKSCLHTTKSSTISHPWQNMNATCSHFTHTIFKRGFYKRTVMLLLPEACTILSRT